ncbi:hypothetical protein Tco_0130270 [Tanacetum coccineum]
MFTDYTTKVDSEPPNGSNDDITNPYECDQTLNVGASTTNLSVGSRDSNLMHINNDVCSHQFRPRSSSIDDMTSVHISSGLALQRHMASTDNTSGPAPQRKERCTLQCTLSLEEEKSSYLRAVLSTTSISSHARSVNKWINVH